MRKNGDTLMPSRLAPRCPGYSLGRLVPPRASAFMAVVLKRAAFSCWAERTQCQYRSRRHLPLIRYGSGFADPLFGTFDITATAWCSSAASGSIPRQRSGWSAKAGGTSTGLSMSGEHRGGRLGRHQRPLQVANEGLFSKG